jgi:hypothetical protein
MNDLKGIVVTAELAASKCSNYEEIFKPVQYSTDVAVINDATA